MRTKTLVWTFFLLASCSIIAVAQALQDDISGMYSFLRDGEYVQINVSEDKEVTGFVERFGDSDSDRGQFLDHFFEKASLEGTRPSFRTKFAHAVAFEFQGTVQRGTAPDREHVGYLVLKGTLTQYRRDAEGKETASKREVEFRSLPADLSKAP